MSLQVYVARLRSRGHIMGMQDSTLEFRPSLSPSQIADLRLAASQMSGPTRRAFEAEMAGKALREQGYSEEQLPSPSTMAEVLNRMGFRLRKVVKAKPQKKIKETDAIFDNIKKR